MPHHPLMAPHPALEMKSMGLVTLGVTGNLNKKSSSAGFTSFFISRIWKRERCMYISSFYCSESAKGLIK